MNEAPDPYKKWRNYVRSQAAKHYKATGEIERGPAFRRRLNIGTNGQGFIFTIGTAFEAPGYPPIKRARFDELLAEAQAMIAEG